MMVIAKFRIYVIFKLMMVKFSLLFFLCMVLLRKSVVLDFVNVGPEEVSMCRCSTIGYCIWVVLELNIFESNSKVREQMRFVTSVIYGGFLFLFKSLSLSLNFMIVLHLSKEGKVNLVTGKFLLFLGCASQQ